jgi:hypothetical protein
MSNFDNRGLKFGRNKWFLDHLCKKKKEDRDRKMAKNWSKTSFAVLDSTILLSTRPNTGTIIEAITNK